MRKLLLLLSLVTISVSAAAEDAIRSFSIPTIEALGQALYRQDAMAAKAFDALFAAHPEAAKAPIKGWITETGQENRRVFFIQERDGQLSLAYLAKFGDRGAPQIEDQKGSALPDFVAKRFAARLAAIAAITNFMGERYNFEVLDDPDGEGFLVYGLASTKDPKEVVMGGHYRVSVSADGKVEKVDALSRSYMVLEKRSSKASEGVDSIAFSTTHIVSDTPVETHVFVNLLHKLPIYVAVVTEKEEPDVWVVNGGKITRENDKK